MGLIVAMSGCGSPAPQEKQKAAAPPTKAAQEPAAKTAGATALPGLAELSPEDRAAAEKQRVCPVTGEVLGMHGKPIKVVVKEQTVYLCCAGCEKELLAKPDKYLAKLKPDATK